MQIAKDVCVEVAKNAAMKIPPVRRWRLRSPRSFLLTEVGSLDRFAFEPLRRLEAAGVSVEGKSVCEIGPGDTLVSGLVFLAAGASSYTAIDRFPGDYSGSYARRWYKAVRREWPVRFPDKPWPEDLDVERYPEGMRTIALAVEDLSLHRVGERFDVLCSFQVGEHVTDIWTFALKTRDLIFPDGVAVHRVDFGPHGPWTKYDDPLTFLRIPEWLWKLMGSARGIPNRRRPHEFREAFAASMLEAREVERETLAVTYVCRHARTAPMYMTGPRRCC